MPNWIVSTEDENIKPISEMLRVFNENRIVDDFRKHNKCGVIVNCLSGQTSERRIRLTFVHSVYFGESYITNFYQH